MRVDITNVDFKTGTCFNVSAVIIVVDPGRAVLHLVVVNLYGRRSFRPAFSCGRQRWKLYSSRMPMKTDNPTYWLLRNAWKQDCGLRLRIRHCCYAKNTPAPRGPGCTSSRTPCSVPTRYSAYNISACSMAMMTLVHVAEDDGARFDADLQIVVAIDHGVHRVVDGRPDDAGEKDDPRDARNRAALGHEHHGHAPAERHAEIELRQRKKPLEERITDGERRADDRHADGGRVELQHQRERDAR